MVSALEGAESSTAAGQYLVYIGTYTGAKSKGIYAYRLDTATGKLTSLGLAAETVNPTFLALHPNRRFLYAANETDRFAGKPGGAVSAFAIDPASGKLTFLNEQSSGGAGPCHLVVDGQGKNVLVANYGGGSTAVLPLQDNGHVMEINAFMQHRGSSVNRQRQEGPHAHGIALDTANRYAFVCDLGLDKVMIYKFDFSKASIVTNELPWVAIKPGSGPRHIAFDPQGRHAYVINELSSTVTALTYDAGRGLLTESQTISTLPENFRGNNTCAEIALHPSGSFLYGSNRGHNSIAVFGVEDLTGRLAPVEQVSTQGKTPRNFGIDPSGAFLLAANQDSDNVVVFRIDPKTGRLTPTGQTVSVGAPVCVVFVSMK